MLIKSVLNFKAKNSNGQDKNEESHQVLIDSEPNENNLEKENLNKLKSKNDLNFERVKKNKI